MISAPVTSGFRSLTRWATLALFFAFALLVAPGSTPRIAELERNFSHPPPSARPWIFWFWLNGNVSSNGITADLEAMQRVGIGGVIIMDVDQGVPQGPIAFASPEWVNLFKHVCGEAKRLGLEVNMNNDAGWCGSGGPWITPELSMQKVVWSETSVRGPGVFRGALAQPKTPANYYRDIAVLALPTPESDTVKMTESSPRITASVMGEQFDPRKLLDDDAKTFVTLPRPIPGKPEFLQLEFAKPFRARRLKLTLPGLSAHKMCQGAVQISENGETFTTIREFDADASSISLNFDEVNARYYRVEFSKAEWYLERINIAEADLSPEFRIDDIDAKAMFVANKDGEARSKPSVPSVYHRFNLSSNVDLTERLSNGQLSWNVPEGTWTILRFGHASTGEDNMPAPESGRGLECDKLSKEAARAAFDGLIGKLAKALGPLTGKVFAATHVDSWEVGSQNWTPRFREEFKGRRGYDPLPFLPVMTGRVINSLEISERFLWDVRQTVSDLIVENYAGELERQARKRGMELTMEAYDLNPCDDLPFAGRVSQPMGEFWMWPAYGVSYSLIEMASAAHAYGKPIVSAEAFTSTDAEKWSAHPFTAKVFGDWAFCHGINRFVLHRYAHQPWTKPDRPPGMSMGPWGLHYERTQTWWEESRAWHEYLARCQYLLQQGLYVADICYVQKEGAPQKWEAPGHPKERPGYNFDGCPPEIVARMSVKNGRVVLPDGMSYQLLTLSDSRLMTPELLTEITRLVRAGATVIGPKPGRSPSLKDYPYCDDDVEALADDLWGDCDGKSVTEHRLGKGRIIWGRTPQQVLAQTGLPEDFSSQTSTSANAIRYTHRVIGSHDLFFLANKLPQSTEALCVFRVHNKRPEFWWPDHGTRELPAVYQESDGMTKIPIRFDPNGSVFVIFRGDMPPDERRITRLGKDGETILGTELGPAPVALVRTNEGVTNEFTMAAWVKPALEIDIPEQSKMGIGGLHVIRNDALYPPPGQDVYAMAGHAGAGISVGRNGVCVFEHGDNYFASPLVFGTRLTNWTHVAVVYRNGQPLLYLNGMRVHDGLKSDFVVHPGVGVPHGRGMAPFRGEKGEFQQENRALGDAEVARLMEAMPKPPDAKELPRAELIRGEDGRIIARIWEPGHYQAETASGGNVDFNSGDFLKPIELSGSWEVRFEKGRGAPEAISLDRLGSWTDHWDPGIKYYSGHALYRQTFRLPGGHLEAGQHWGLDLGEVDVIAQVWVNGKSFGTLWKPPFRMDVTGALMPGENTVEVKVVNLWCNRMIGDEQLPDDSPRKENGTLNEWPAWLLEGKPSPTGRYTFTTWRLWQKTAPLQQSGLVGPVRLLPFREMNLSAGR